MRYEISTTKGRVTAHSSGLRSALVRAAHIFGVETPGGATTDGILAALVARVSAVTIVVSADEEIVIDKTEVTAMPTPTPEVV